MKRAASSSLIVLSRRRVVRADFDAAGNLKTWSTVAGAEGRPVGEQTALSLKGKPGAHVWVMIEDAWTQQITLTPAQVAGLTPEQLNRALSFEVEPYSGISAEEGALGFRKSREGEFSVVQIPRADRDSIQRAIKAAGAVMAGIVPAEPLPENEEALVERLAAFSGRLERGEFPVVPPPPVEPSPRRFLVVGIGLEVAALLIVLAAMSWTTLQRRNWEKRHAEMTAATRAVETASKVIEELKGKIAAIEKAQTQLELITARRGSLHALLDGLARTCPPDVLLQSIEPDGPSGVTVSGLALEPRAVDELNIVLRQNLRTSGWSAQLRRKKGRKTRPNGGPWEFSLALHLDETNRAQSLQLSQATPE